MAYKARGIRVCREPPRTVGYLDIYIDGQTDGFLPYRAPLPLRSSTKSALTQIQTSFCLSVFLPLFPFSKYPTLHNIYQLGVRTVCRSPIAAASLTRLVFLSVSLYSLYSCSLISMLVYLTISCFSIVPRSKYIQTISLLYLSVCLASLSLCLQQQQLN